MIKTGELYRGLAKQLITAKLCVSRPKDVDVRPAYSQCPQRNPSLHQALRPCSHVNEPMIIASKSRGDGITPLPIR